MLFDKIMFLDLLDSEINDSVVDEEVAAFER
jgi:hypothetical protein